MAYKPFKMKGHTLPGINQRSEGNTDLPDGRSASSAFQYKESPAKKSKQGEYLTNVKTGEIRENFPDSFSIIKEGTKTVHRTKENKDDWQPSDKTGKLHPKLEKMEKIGLKKIPTGKSPAKHNRKQGHSHTTRKAKGGGKINLATYDDGAVRDVTHLTGKKAKSPGKWVQFIPMALSALGSMSKNKEE